MRPTTLLVLAAAVAAVVSACSFSSSTSAPPSDAWGSVDLVSPQDENPDPNVLEVRIDAAEITKSYAGGAPAKVWAYNGTVPGPLLDVKVGDRVIVHFSNHLPEPTTIHWHGVRVPAAMDGTLMMQSPIPPGGTFDYDFTVKDAGFFWFHPHVQGDSQVRKGLYGALRVRGRDEPTVDHEALLMLGDITVQPDGTISDYLDDTSRMMGREGKTLLVNGRAEPTLPVRAGSLQRLRFVNVANGRFFNLAAPGVRWRVIGTDGGFLPQPYDADHLLIAPGERYDVVFVPSGPPDSEIVLLDDPYDRGHDSAGEPSLPLAKLHVTAEHPLDGRALPDRFPEIERLPDGVVDRKITLAEGLANGEVTFTIDGAAYPDVPLWDVAKGSVERILFENASEMDHPMHLHGVFFQLLESGGVAVAPSSLANKDTIIVPKKGSLKVVARFEEPGNWAYHCHILEHAEYGMLGEIRVR